MHIKSSARNIAISDMELTSTVWSESARAISHYQKYVYKACKSLNL